jgi:hypothetical protein
MYRSTACLFAAALALGGAALIATPAQAVTSHCDSSLYPNKVELDGSQTTVQTHLAAGTAVCIKAGNSTVTVYVDADGNITQGSILNKPGNAYLGVSYYAYSDDCVPRPYSNDCQGY